MSRRAKTQEIKELIRELVEQKNWSARELGRHADINPTTAAELVDPENTRDVRMQTLDAVAVALKVPTFIFLMSPDERTLWNRFINSAALDEHKLHMQIQEIAAHVKELKEVKWGAASGIAFERIPESTLKALARASQVATPEQWRALEGAIDNLEQGHHEKINFSRLPKRFLQLLGQVSNLPFLDESDFEGPQAALVAAIVSQRGRALPPLGEGFVSDESEEATPRPPSSTPKRKKDPA